MDLFTIDNIGETKLLNQNTNESNSVKFIKKLDVLNEVKIPDNEVINKAEVEEDENLSDLDFGGKCYAFHLVCIALTNFITRLTTEYNWYFPCYQTAFATTENRTPTKYG